MGRKTERSSESGWLRSGLVLGVSLLALALALVAVAPAGAAAQEVGGVSLQSSGETGLEFTVSLDPALLELDPVTVEGIDYVRVHIAGWPMTGTPGAPELPFVLSTLGAPHGSEVRVEVEPGPARLVHFAAPVAPVATISAEMDWEAVGAGELALPMPVKEMLPDAALYGSGAAYPGALAAVVSDGQMRGQRVVGVAAYPVQYDPAAGVLAVYEELRVRVSFEGAMPGQRPATAALESPDVESLLEGRLLNYDQARGWRGEARAAAPEVAPWKPPAPGYRVYVEGEGFFKLTHAELQAAGFLDGNPSPATFRLYNEGQEVAIQVELGGDGTFDSGDYLLFYAVDAGSKYTQYNVYWLTHGQGTTKAMGDHDGTPAGGTTPATFVDRVHMEADKFYITSLLGDEDLDRFVWDYLYPPSRPQWSHTFSLPDPVTTGPVTGTLTLAMFGNLKNPIDPDHHTKILVNGTVVEDATWDGTAWRIATPDVPQALLAPGNNTLLVQAPNDTGVGYDLVYLDWAELVYTSTFTVGGDALSFSYDVAGSLDYVLDGFTTSDIVAFDVTDPANVKTISGGVSAVSGAGYSFTFSDAVPGVKEYRVLTPSQYGSAARIELDTPSDLTSPQNGADYIVVTHKDFAAAVAPLAAHRAAQGLRVVQVDVQDVYDQFGYGLASAQAIRAFFKLAYNVWQPPAPSFALLVGDGHYDPKDNGKHGRPSYIPPYLAPVDPWITETAADNLYVSLTPGDILADMMLGRLPANSAAEATVMVDKILNYEQNLPPGDWSQQLLMVADNKDLGGEFDSLSDDILACCLPGPYQPEKVYYQVTHNTTGDTTAAIISGISAGKLVVNYIGHASITNWAGEPLFRSTHIPSLTNGDRLPIMLPMTCYEGYHHRPLAASGDALAEAIVRVQGKGAVASWSPTGLGVATGHDHLNRGFYKALFQNGVRTLGQAALAGKIELAAAGKSPDLLNTYSLFGDPGLQIPALDADLRLEKSVEPAGMVDPGTVLTYTLTFSNTGPAMAHNIVLTDVVPAELLNPTVVYSSANVIGEKPGAPFAWNIADLSAGEGGEIRFTAQVPASSLPQGMAIKNKATIAMAEPDTEPANNTASTSTAVSPPPGYVWKLYLPFVPRAYDPTLYDDFGNIAYDHAYNPALWSRTGHASYNVGQWVGGLVFGSGMAPANTGADLYLIKPPQRSLDEVQDFETKLKFDAGQVGGFASVRTQISMDQGGGKGWWTQCMLSAGNSSALFYACDVSTYDGPNRTTEYRTPQIPTSFGVWHTAKIEADPGTARLSFYLDGVLIGTHLPQDAAALLSATNLSPKVGVWNGALGITAERSVDDVRITWANR